MDEKTAQFYEIRPEVIEAPMYTLGAAITNCAPGRPTDDLDRFGTASGSG